MELIAWDALGNVVKNYSTTLFRLSVRGGSDCYLVDERTAHVSPLGPTGFVRFGGVKIVSTANATTGLWRAHLLCERVHHSRCAHAANVSCTLAVTVYNGDNETALVITPVLDVRVTGCPPGEHVVFGGCFACDVGDFSVRNDCVPCPQDRTCVSVNQSGMFVLPGFWLESWEEQILIACPRCTGYNCGGDSCVPSNGRVFPCLPGSSERLCSVCIEGYFARSVMDSDTPVCEPCSESGAWPYILLPVLLAVLVVLFVALPSDSLLLIGAELIMMILLAVLGVGAFSDLALVLVFLALLDAWTSRDHHSHSHNDTPGGPQPGVTVVGGAKLLLFFLQTASALCRSMIPRIVHSLLGVLAFIRFRLNGLECTAALRPLVVDPAWQYVLLFALPVLVLLVLSTLVLLRHTCRALFARLRHGDAFSWRAVFVAARSSIGATVLFLLYIGYFEAALATAELFVCQDGYMETAPAVPCFQFSIVLAGTILGGGYVVLVPLGFSIYLARNRKRLEDPAVETRIGFLYHTWKLYYFEFFWIARRVAFAGVIAIPESLQAARAMLVLTVAASAAGLTWVMAPWKRPLENTLDLAALMLLQVTFGTLSSAEPQPTYQWLLFVGNAAFVALVLVLMLKQPVMRLVSQCRLRVRDGGYMALARDGLSSSLGDAEAVVVAADGDDGPRSAVLQPLH